MDQFAGPKIRNVVLLSHSGAGKTSLAEAMMRLSEAANGAAHVNMLRNLATAWPRSPLPKKVIWN